MILKRPQTCLSLATLIDHDTNGLASIKKTHAQRYVDINTKEVFRVTQMYPYNPLVQNIQGVLGEEMEYNEQWSKFPDASLQSYSFV